MSLLRSGKAQLRLPRSRTLVRGTAGLGLVGLTIALIVGSIEYVDRPVALFFKTTASEAVQATALVISVLSSPIPYFLSAALAFGYFKFERQNAVQGRRALFILLASTTAPFAADMLKIVFGRARPHLFFDAGIYAFHPLTNSLDFSSFPSEHAAVATAMMMSFSALLPTYRPTFLLLAILTAFCRVVVGAHYPSDLLAGTLVGLADIAALSLIFRYYKIELSEVKS